MESIILTPDQARAYVIATSPSGQREIIAISTAGFSVVSRESLGTFGESQLGTGALTGEVAAISSDGSALYLWRADDQGTPGIGRFDLKSKQATALSGPWNLVAGGLVPLPASSVFPEGILVAVGLRSDPGPRGGQSRVYFLHPTSLAVLDSISPAAIANEDDVWQFLRGAEAQTAYVATPTLLLRFDLLQRQTTASLTREASGMLALVPGANTIVLTDVGTWPDSPGSGLLRLYDLSLRFIGNIDVSAPLGGVVNSVRATRTGAAVAGSDGRTLYVRAGSESRGPLYPIQPARLLTIDVLAKHFVTSTTLGGYGLGPTVFAAP